MYRVIFITLVLFSCNGALAANFAEWMWLIVPPPYSAGVVIMAAAVIEIPLEHPSRRSNPYSLRVPNAPMFRCAHCDEGFNERWNLDLHLLDKHPGGGQKTKMEWW
jgi:hypothetical protein